MAPKEAFQVTDRSTEEPWTVAANGMVPPVAAEAVEGTTSTEVTALGCVVPIPLRETTVGELGALSTKEALPEALPDDVGANRRAKVMF
jgi:hypothetical protein